MRQSSCPASSSLMGLTLWPSRLERWLAILSGLSTHVRIPAGCWCRCFRDVAIYTYTQKAMEKEQGKSEGLIAATGLVMLLKLDSNRRLFSPRDLKILWIISKNDRATLLHHIQLCASFQTHQLIHTGVTVRKRSIRVKMGAFFVPCDLEIWWMTLINNRAPLLCCDKLCASFKDICEFKLDLPSGNTQFGSKSANFCPVWPWNLTDDLEKQQSTSPSNIKLCASFHHHMWIQTGAIVPKRLSWVMTSVTLTYDLFCMDISSVIDNNYWKCHDHTMLGT